LRRTPITPASRVISDDLAGGFDAKLNPPSWL
jgi:hypothetical protein